TSWPRATANWWRSCAGCVASRGSRTPGPPWPAAPGTEPLPLAGAPSRWRRRARFRLRVAGRIIGAFPSPWIAMSQREWVAAAIRKIEADFNRSADTHLIPMPLPGYPGIDVYLKDESSHPTGSLKHRLARSLFLYALANGWLR